MTPERLLAESVEDARRRERTSFAALAGDAQNKVVLFGAGQLGRKVLGVLRRHGVEPLAFADNSSALQGILVDGLAVLSPAEAAKRFGATAVFVVSIFRGTGDGGMSSRLSLLRSLGCKRVSPFLPLAWQLAGDLLPHYGAALPSTLLSAAADLTAVDSAWSDAESREVFRAQLHWRLRGDFSALKPPSPDQYFPSDLFAVRADEAFVDGGAFDGDTLRAMGTNFSKAWAIEPNPIHAARLRSAGDPRITVFEVALGAESSEAQFAAEHGVASALCTAGSTTVKVETLDRLLDNQSPTLLKLDIEGAEQSALKGGAKLLGRTKPIVAVCVYHRPDDLWKIPLFLRENLPDHRLFLRVHQHDGFELVAYAVPPKRMP